MRALLAFSVLFALTLSFQTPGLCQDDQGTHADFGLGVIGGPTFEVRNERWLLQGTWLMWVVSNLIFDSGSKTSGDVKLTYDNGFVLRGDYVIPHRDSGGEVGLGATYAYFSDNRDSNIGNFGANLQYIYYVRPDISLQLGLDCFPFQEESSVDLLLDFGIMFHF